MNKYPLLLFIWDLCHSTHVWRCSLFHSTSEKEKLTVLVDNAYGKVNTKMFVIFSKSQFFQEKKCVLDFLRNDSFLFVKWQHIIKIKKWFHGLTLCVKKQTQRHILELFTFTLHAFINFHKFSSVAQLCSTLCESMDSSMPGFPIHHQLLEFAQTQVHWVGDAIQPSHPLSFPSPPAFNLSQHLGLFQWVNSLPQVAKVLEFQYQSFQWIFRTDLL